MESQSVEQRAGRFPEWTGRPLAIASVGLILGLVAGPVNLILGLIAMAVAFGNKSIWALGFAGLGYFMRPLPPNPILGTTEFNGNVVVTSPPKRTPYATLVVVTTSSHRIRVQLAPGASAVKGATYHVEGKLRPSSDGYAASDIRQGIEGVLIPTPSSWNEIQPGPGFFARAEDLSLGFHQYLNRFPPNEAALMEALVTGNDGYLDDAVENNLKKGGVLHLVAASGMQVQFFAVALALLLRLVPIPRWIQVIALLVVLTFYAALAGLGVSILRAVIMATTEALAPYFRRTYDSISSLAFAAIILLVTNPYWAMSPGFYLSFGGMLAIILMGGMLRRRKRWVSEFGKSIGAAIATTPTTMFFFGSTTPYGAVATLALSFWASGLMLCSLVGFAVEQSGLWFIQVPVDFVCKTIASAFLNFVKAFADLPGSFIAVSQSDPTLIAWAFFFVALTWRPPPIESAD